MSSSIKNPTEGFECPAKNGSLFYHMEQTSYVNGIFCGQVRFNEYIMNYFIGHVAECLEIDGDGNVIDGYVGRSFPKMTYRGKTFTEHLTELKQRNNETLN